MKVSEVMVKPETINASDLATKAREISRKTGSELVVLEEGRPSGIVDDSSLLKLPITKSNIPVKSISQPLRITLSKNVELLAAASLMSEAGTSTATVIENKKMVGIITNRALLHGFTRKKYSPVSKNVESIVRKSGTLDENDTIDLALRKLKKQPAIPVLRKRALVGMLTLREVVTKSKSRSAGGRASASIGGIMKTPAPTISIDAGVGAAARKLLKSGFPALVVLRGKKVEGIISEKDIIGAYLR